ncbi:MAG: CocE/NonD family hydrolase [Albidovulum sp.]|nr:CocE/NonD family hydrolase [Albidovulum sp.]
MTKFRIREVEHCWIPMPDGIRLAARIWMPEGEGGSYPAILEYIPYRKRDLVRARDERNHPYFAAHGYACLRVDIRGSGDSEGAMPDMYGKDELDDARHLIQWIASQPWCNGRIGMFGTSWGGTASLQAAVNAPIPLKAVLANCATWDRFEDDIHWMGGCLLTDSLEWGATLPAILAAPPDSATVGAAWLDAWNRRLEKLSFPLRHWMRNDVRGRYWRRGSVRFRVERLSCPILSIGGWSDRYSNSVLPLVKARPDICWGIVGPWGHHYPDQGEPGPAIGFQDLALEWWDHWLKPEIPGDLNWPKIRLWKRGFDPPRNRLKVRQGNWIAVHDIGSVSWNSLHLDAGRLRCGPAAAEESLSVPFDMRHGECAGDTGYFGRMGGLPLDQAADDGRSLCFETEPLGKVVDLVGGAALYALIERTAPQAQFVCRLCDVDPNGRSNLVARGILNLELDELMDVSRPFASGERLAYTIRLPSTAYRFAEGHRIRLALAASYWPLAWPTASDPGIRVLSGSRLELPAFPERGDPATLPFPEAKELPERKSWRMLSEPNLERTRQSVRDGKVCSSWSLAPTTTRFDDLNTSVTVGTAAEYGISADGPQGARFQIDHEIEIIRPDGKAKIDSKLIAERVGKVIEAHGILVAIWNGRELARKIWKA